MTPEDFRTAAAAEGYQVVENGFGPNVTNPEHTHPFDAWLLITGGEISISVGDETTTCRTGDTFRVAGNVPHAEQAGPDGVQYLAGRRPAR